MQLWLDEGDLRFLEFPREYGEPLSAFDPQKSDLSQEERWVTGKTKTLNLSWCDCSDCCVTQLKKSTAWPPRSHLLTDARSQGATVRTIVQPVFVCGGTGSCASYSRSHSLCHIIMLSHLMHSNTMRSMFDMLMVWDKTPDWKRKTQSVCVWVGVFAVCCACVWTPRRVAFGWQIVT